ncbi:hypothetical protein O6H91_13G043900 [Diphasiastrum complanatum]|uniref:Uncharacterized protein n=1 Tax=Diphasiastrum complanatum TaxID=34168 RepID=A0ACC2BU62_DIPCM|nr:hypothetical protein O6H91_13G043900 [Diphasiastrum complanatum]
MDRYHCCPRNELWKSVWLLGLHVSILFSQVTSQPGFISIDCGAEENYTEQSSGIRWQIDDGYVFSGVNAVTTAAPGQTSMSAQTLRYFPELQKKTCYVLPVAKKVRYLVRSTFAYGNYDQRNRPPQFSLIIDATHVATVNTSTSSSIVHEVILVAKANSLNICLGRTSLSDVPFISSLELRPLLHQMYATADENRILKMFHRINFGAYPSNPTVRYPDDPFDRVWRSDSQVIGAPGADRISTSSKVVSLVPVHVPSAVMTTAVMQKDVLLITLPLISDITTDVPLSLFLYFARIENRKFAQEDLSFTIYMDNVISFPGVSTKNSAGSRKSKEFMFQLGSISNPVNITLAASSSLIGTIVNAMELYGVLPITAPTFFQDVEAIFRVKDSLNLVQWSGDPCLPNTWDWLTCSTTSNITRITAVKLSNRNLSGPIPVAITNLTALTHLHLNDNNLTGMIPSKLSTLRDLQELYLSNNMLNSTVPTELVNNVNLNLLYDKSFYGSSIRASSDKAVSNSTSGISAKNSKSTNQSRVLHIILLTFMTLILLGLALTLICWCFLRLKKPIDKGYPVFDRIRSLKAYNDVVKFQKTLIGGPPLILQQTRPFPSILVRLATENFSKMIGEGGFGPVYYGKLSDGQEIAVKVHGPESDQGPSEFYNEVAILSRAHHRHVVSLLGFCIEPGNQMLVYEYLSGGTLEEHLHGTESIRPLDWRTRLNIALEASKGLEYLHNGCNPPIIHRDVKTGNILLTKTMAAKVSDFGLSKLGPDGGHSHISTTVRGTSGYLDPEYYDTQKLSLKSDVYSFGVVLLELITGREPIISEPPRKCWKLCDWAREMLLDRRIEAIIDPVLGRGYNIESIWKVAEIAMFSVEPRSKHRPTISDVVQELKDALGIENGDLLISDNFTLACPPLRLDNLDVSDEEPIYSRSFAQSRNPYKNRRMTS